MGTDVDREAVVRRHTVEVTSVDPASPLSVGNGEICWTVDVTGLQTFPDQYPVTDPAGGAAGTLLGTQSQWGWHSSPEPAGAEGASLDVTRRRYRSGGREVPYVDAPPQSGSDDSALGETHRWLRANPHRLDLVRIGLVIRDVPDGGARPDGEGGGGRPRSGPSGGGPERYRTPSPSDLGKSRQRLDLWTGVLTSEVSLAGRSVQVTTACHPTLDALAVRIVADPADGPGLGVRLAFPYGSQSWSNPADWTRPGDHTTALQPLPDGALLSRSFDGAPAAHVVRLRTGSGGVVERTGEHEVLVTATGSVLDLVVHLAPTDHTSGAVMPGTPGADEVVASSARHWPAFWGRGAALDLSGSTDPRAAELERRVVLSQYLTAIQCAGSLPPQETGLTTNSWRGRFHLEMHWWHGAHFALWGRPDLLERSLGWYAGILDQARATAELQGYAGARWPKQVGPDGRESPSDIGPFLLWQQPHLIHLAELVRRARPEAATELQERYGEVVDATARFMADVAQRTPEGYALGPPLVPAQETYASLRDQVVNPPFELAQWAWALDVAQGWRERAGLPREPHWDEVATGLVSPVVRDGRYAAIGVEPWTVREDHPSMVYGLGVVPPTAVMDPEVVRRTLHSVLDDWQWPTTWGWDFPALAMTAARLGEPQTAVDVLLRPEVKNTYLPNGHNRQTDQLPLYLPGNGGLLAAVALMVGGWDGSGPVPGLPDDGTWVVRHEGFVRSP